MSVILVFSAPASTSDSLVGAEPEPLPVAHLGSRVVLKYEEGLLKAGGIEVKSKGSGSRPLGFHPASAACCCVTLNQLLTSGPHLSR